MTKRTMAELRKIRKREQVLIEAMAEIKAWNDEEVGDQSIHEIVEGCISELNEINKKEEFLTNLELPKHDTSAESILAKIRALSDNPPTPPKTLLHQIKDKLNGDDE